MADSTAKKVVYESKEALYEKAVQKMEADQYIVQTAFRAENFRIAAAMFEELGDYQDAPGLAMRCRDLAEKAEEKGKEISYERCVRRLQEPEQSQSILQKAKDELTQLGDYKDAPQLLETCTAKLERMSKREKIGGWLKIGALALIVLAVIGAFTSGLFYYAEGIVIDRMGNYKAAEKIFASMPGFLDSDRYVVLEQRRSLEHAKVGSNVKFGKYTWKVLRREDGILTLIAADISKGHDFFLVQYNDEKKDVTWKDCSLRAWLNGEIYENSFSSMERSRILPQTIEETHNTEYGTGYEEKMEDYLTLLSLEETPDYQKSLDALGLDYWLRSPGHSYDTAAFMSAGRHNRMYYGYPVDSEALTVRPIIKVDVKNISREALDE